jgi:hypothetical protein
MELLLISYLTPNGTNLLFKEKMVQTTNFYLWDGVAVTCIHTAHALPTPNRTIQARRSRMILTSLGLSHEGHVGRSPTVTTQTVIFDILIYRYFVLKLVKSFMKLSYICWSCIPLILYTQLKNMLHSYHIIYWACKVATWSFVYAHCNMTHYTRRLQMPPKKRSKRT